jgi:cytochrome c-type biogenesis protein CcmH/NrfG
VSCYYLHFCQVPKANCLTTDQNDAQSWYLLGRCYMSQQKYPKAYEAYQQAVYRDGRNPTFWCSIGVLYYQINQYRDALDAYSRAIRLNPNISEVWYDLGTLVSLLPSPCVYEKRPSNVCQVRILQQPDRGCSRCLPACRRS